MANLLKFCRISLKPRIYGQSVSFASFPHYKGIQLKHPCQLSNPNDTFPVHTPIRWISCSCHCSQHQTKPSQASAQQKKKRRRNNNLPKLAYKASIEELVTNLSKHEINLLQKQSDPSPPLQPVEISEPDRTNILAARFHTSLSSSLQYELQQSKLEDALPEEISDKHAKRKAKTKTKKAESQITKSVHKELSDKQIKRKAKKKTKMATESQLSSPQLEPELEPPIMDLLDIPPSSRELGDILYHDDILPTTRMRILDAEDEEAALDREEREETITRAMLGQYKGQYKGEHTNQLNQKRNGPKTSKTDQPPPPKISDLLRSDFSEVKEALPAVLKRATLFSRAQKEALRGRAVVEDGALYAESHATDLQCFVDVSIAAGTKHLRKAHSLVSMKYLNSHHGRGGQRSRKDWQVPSPGVYTSLLKAWAHKGTLPRVKELYSQLMSIYGSGSSGNIGSPYPVTTPPLGSSPATTPPLGSSPAATPPLGSSLAATPPLGSLPPTTPPLGSSPAATPPLDSSPSLAPPPVPLAAFVACLECIGRGKRTDEKTEFLATVLSDLEAHGYLVERIAQDVNLSDDEWSHVLTAIHQIRPDFEPVPFQYEQGYTCSLLNSLNSPHMSENPAHQVLTEQELEERTHRQIEAELGDAVTVESILPMGTFTESNKKAQVVLADCEAHMREALTNAFQNMIQFETLCNRHRNNVNLLPYLEVFPVQDYVELMLQEIRELATVQDIKHAELKKESYFTPDTRLLHSGLGRRLFRKFVLKQRIDAGYRTKLEKMYKEYVAAFSADSLQLNHRQIWQEIVQRHGMKTLLSHDFTEWPYDTCRKLGKVLYNMILSEVRVDRNIFSTQPKNEVPAFHIIYRQRNDRVAEEILPHPALVRLYWEAKSNQLSFEPAELPTLVPPMPWTEVQSGGSLLASDSRLVRYPFSASKELKKLSDLPRQQLYPVLDALNAVSSTPWRINKPVLDVIIRLFCSGGDSSQIGRAHV